MFESHALLVVPAHSRSQADLPLCIYHPMPRNTAVFRQRVQGVPHLPSMSPQARQRGYLPIGGDPTPGDPPDHGVDTRVCVAWQFGVSEDLGL